MKHVIDALKASKEKAKTNRDNWKKKALTYKQQLKEACEIIKKYEELEDCPCCDVELRELSDNHADDCPVRKFLDMNTLLDMAHDPIDTSE